MRARTLMPAVAAACAVLAGCGGGSSTRSATRRASPAAAGGSAATPPRTAATHPAAAPPAPRSSSHAGARPPARSRAPFAVGERVITLIDPSRTIDAGGVHRARTLVTLVRYPVGARGPFPLVVFGHGFAVTPAPYAPLLRAWARAGYIVAAPIFPLENAGAPGGPDENDLVNQPADMSLVITRLLRASARGHGFLAGMIAPAEVAVSGQSDGGETALAVAYDRYFVDRRVRAAVILSGAEIPGVGGFDFPAPSPPLLATQGTADTINPPSFTAAFYDIAPRPKFLLTMFGAPHLPPYTDEQPQLGIVERVTIAFLDHYLKHGPRGLARMAAAGNVRGVAALTAEP